MYYVLYSLKDNRIYKGYSTDLIKRLLAHNNGQTTSTKNRRPLILLYFEIFDNKPDALKRERESKTLEGGALLRETLIMKKLLNTDGRINC